MRTPWFLILAGALVLLWGCAIRTATSHSWYPPVCCSDHDCRPVACDDLVETNDGGYRYLSDEGNVSYRRDQVKLSQDRKCHVCFSSARTPYCVFIQAGS